MDSQLSKMISEYMLLKIFIITGVTAYIVGPVKFKLYARQSGYLAGNLVKLIRESTAVYQEVVKDKDLSKMSDELKTDMQSLKKISQQLSIGRNLMRSPTQLVRLANSYEEIQRSTTEIEPKPELKELQKIEMEPKENLSEKMFAGDLRVNSVPNTNVGGAIYVSKTAIMIQKSKKQDEQKSN